MFENIHYMGKEDSENCMRIEVIDLLSKELQMEDSLLKSQAKLKERLDTLEETNPKSVFQEINDALLKEISSIQLKPRAIALKDTFLRNEETSSKILSSFLKSKKEEELPTTESKHWDPRKYKQLVNKEKKLGNSMNCQDNAKEKRKLWDPGK
ncbi:hypothetical protein PIB30_107755 [Stylosanthes scabra]|uniref:Uncharacterized protein n=1 Tax=Stylosanthes scabra TaxID=79078 RepID=A0ABU6VXW6_9FABA|nr:hypothetical protein [Stylosanthes scabra]